MEEEDAGEERPGLAAWAWQLGMGSRHGLEDGLGLRHGLEAWGREGWLGLRHMGRGMAGAKQWENEILSKT